MLLILTVAHPDAWEVCFMSNCVMFYTPAEHGIYLIFHTQCIVPSQYNLPRELPHSEYRGDLTVYSTSPRIVQHTLDWGRRRAWSFAPRTVLDVGDPSYWDALLPVLVEVVADRVACVAFPAEAGTDDPGDDASQGYRP